jgi:hypothetical protein
MPRPLSVLLLLLVVYGFLSPPGARAQETPTDSLPVLPEKPFRLEQNDPNPVNPETWIPFILDEELFEDGQPAVVSIRIYNILRQLVAIPTAVDHPRGRNVPVSGLRYTEPGRKVAYWDGRDLNGQRVPASLYYCELVVDGQSDFIRITVVDPRRRSRFFPPFLLRRNRSE